MDADTRPTMLDVRTILGAEAGPSTLGDGIDPPLRLGRQMVHSVPDHAAPRRKNERLSIVQVATLVLPLLVASSPLMCSKPRRAQPHDGVHRTGTLRTPPASARAPRLPPRLPVPEEEHMIIGEFLVNLALLTL